MSAKLFLMHIRSQYKLVFYNFTLQNNRKNYINIITQNT
uniref:Uncharacterized protein n=1 Tax=viral metagenome TaxID=1070528 RepID=A0A6C0B7K2_9ZZZZ